jgi:hypothetical protein
MRVVGANYVHQLVDGTTPSIKMVFNTSRAILFPASEQHRDQKSAGLFYEDDYRGNALAAVLFNGQIKVRYHRAFTDAQVTQLIGLLAEQPELGILRDWCILYQGRELSKPD